MNRLLVIQLVAVVLATLAYALPIAAASNIKPPVDIVAIHAQFAAKDAQIADLKQQLDDAQAEIDHLNSVIAHLKKRGRTRNYCAFV